jgi:hypothetical protein
MVWNRMANIEMAKLKYGMNVSNTYAGMGETRDVEITGKLLPGLDVIGIKEDEFTKVLTPEKTGKKVMKYQDDETDIWF